MPARSPEQAAAEDPRLHAVIELIGRAGGESFQLRYDEEQDPVVWVAVAKIRGPGHLWECAGGRTPAQAAVRLAEELYDGGRCGHCGKPSGVSADWRADHPLATVVCWHVFDPETAKFRRSCEGETTGRAYGWDPRTGTAVGRNDPCPCGSGKKWKRCHGA